jgi:uncharacterized protein involved in exopolysaccharide biosynthesis
MTNFRPRGVVEWLQALWRWKFLILLVTAVVFTAAILVIKDLPNVYKSETTLVISRKQDGSADSVRLATALEKLASRPHLESVINRHNLYRPIVERGAMDSAIQIVQGSIEVETKGRGESPESISISYRHTDPDTAQKVLQDVISVLEITNETIERGTDEEIRSVESQIASVESQLSALGQQRSLEQVRERNADRYFDESTRLEEQRRLAAMSVAQLEDRQLLLESQVKTQLQTIEEQRRIVAALPANSSVRNGGSYGMLVVKKAELEAQLKVYREQYTDKNPKVVQTESQLKEVNRQMAELEQAGSGPEGNANSPEAAELRSLERELARMDAELQVLKRELDRKRQELSSMPAPSAGAPSSAAAQFEVPSETQALYDRLRAQYESLLSRREVLRRQTSVAAGVSPNFFTLIEPPNRPQLPIGPNRQKLQLLALALAFGAALVLVAALEFRRLPYVTDYRDVDYFLGVPVLAQIPESVTPVEQTRQRTIAIARGVGVVLLAAAALPVLVILLNVLGIFSKLAK